MVDKAVQIICQRAARSTCPKAWHSCNTLWDDKYTWKSLVAAYGVDADSLWKGWTIVWWFCRDVFFFSCGLTLESSPLKGYSKKDHHPPPAPQLSCVSRSSMLYRHTVESYHQIQVTLSKNAEVWNFFSRRLLCHHFWGLRWRVKPLEMWPFYSF